MSKQQFSYDIFGYDNITLNKIPQEIIESYYDDWKNSKMSFKLWKALLFTRA